VIQNHFDDDADAALVGGGKKNFEIVERSVTGVDGGVVGDVIAVIAKRRGEKRKEPESGGAERLQVVETLCKPGEIPDAVGVAVAEGADVELIDDRVFVPEVVVLQRLRVRLLRFMHIRN
jgi:hypothetical protein